MRVWFCGVIKIIYCVWVFCLIISVDFVLQEIINVLERYINYFFFNDDYVFFKVKFVGVRWYGQIFDLFVVVWILY